MNTRYWRMIQFICSLPPQDVLLLHFEVTLYKIQRTCENLFHDPNL